MLRTPAQIKPKSFESRRNFFAFFWTRGGCVSCLRACLGARLLPQSCQYPNFSEGADCVGGQLRGDKECPISGVTKSGRVWRKVPESGARSVCKALCRYKNLASCFSLSHELGHPVLSWVVGVSYWCGPTGTAAQSVASVISMSTSGW